MKKIPSLRDDHPAPDRHYPALYEKLVPIALVVIAMLVVVLVLVVFAVAFGLTPGAR